VCLGQVNGWGRIRRALARCVRAVSSARVPIAVASLALVVTGLVLDFASGSGLIGRAAPAAVAPATSSLTPGVRSTPTPQVRPTPTPHLSRTTQLAASTGSVTPTESAVPQSTATAAPHHEPKPRPTCSSRSGCKPSKPSKHGRHRTTTALTASPSPATAGDKVTLTATEKSGTTHPAGHVQFAVGGADIGTAVAVDGNGAAVTTTTFAAPGTERLSAQFTPASTAYTGSKGTFSLVVHPVPANIAGVETISVTVPQTGFFTVSFKPGPVELEAEDSTATGTLGDVTVTDTRNYHPGWSLSGHASAFTSHGDDDNRSVPGTQLGWVPTVVGTLHDGAQLGRTVVPGRPGLGGTPATLAYAPSGCGYGTNILSARLTLDIPHTEEGRYSGVVTITYVESGPGPAGDGQPACGKPSKPPGGDR